MRLETIEPLRPVPSGNSSQIVYRRAPECTNPSRSSASSPRPPVDGLDDGQHLGHHGRAPRREVREQARPRGHVGLAPLQVRPARRRRSPRVGDDLANPGHAEGDEGHLLGAGVRDGHGRGDDIPVTREQARDQVRAAHGGPTPPAWGGSPLGCPVRVTPRTPGRPQPRRLDAIFPRQRNPTARKAPARARASAPAALGRWTGRHESPGWGGAYDLRGRMPDEAAPDRANSASGGPSAEATDGHAPGAEPGDRSGSPRSRRFRRGPRSPARARSVPASAPASPQPATTVDRAATTTAKRLIPCLYRINGASRWARAPVPQRTWVRSAGRSALPREKLRRCRAAKRAALACRTPPP